MNIFLTQNTNAHVDRVVVAVTDSTGKLVMESILETEAATILQFSFANNVTNLRSSVTSAGDALDKDADVDQSRDNLS